MWLHGIYLLAIVAEAMTACLAAAQRRMDIFGALMIAWVTALGGGTVRDLLLGHYPLSWVAHPVYLLYTSAAAFAAMRIAPWLHRLKQAFLWLDALGLVAFTLIGADVARAMAASLSTTVMAGMLTGCCGGILRDVLLNRVPLIFRKELYALVSALTALLYLGLLRLGLGIAWASAVSLVAGFGLRLLAIYRHWALPRLNHRVR